jgi:acetone carboxylase gamma subunit
LDRFHDRIILTTSISTAATIVTLAFYVFLAGRVIAAAIAFVAKVLVTVADEFFIVISAKSHIVVACKLVTAVSLAYKVVATVIRAKDTHYPLRVLPC